MGDPRAMVTGAWEQVPPPTMLALDLPSTCLGMCEEKPHGVLGKVAGTHRIADRCQRGRRRTILPSPDQSGVFPQPGATTASLGASGGRLRSSHHVALAHSWEGSPHSALALLPLSVFLPP